MEARGSSAAAGHVPSPPTDVRRILLVEDDEDDAVFVADLLESWPAARLQTVVSVGQAIARLAEEGADCVLLDLGLPDAAGLDAVDALLAAAPEAAIVVLTGDADEQRGAAAVAAGAQDFLVKGRIDAAGLARTIRYAAERRSMERWRREAAVARAQEAESARLQRGLLPAPLVGDAPVALATAYRPGARRQLLGGDFYDVVQSDDGVLHAVVGDVAGHGPDEAALGVRLRMAWRTLVLAGMPSGELLELLDRILAVEREHDAVFTTLVHVELAPGARSCVVRCAGHAPPLVVVRGRAVPAPVPPSPALGLDAGARWPGTELALEPGWGLLLFSDGIHEGRRAPGARERLDVDGLVELLDGPPDDAQLQRLIAEAERRHGGALTDDVALLGLVELPRG